MGLSAEHLAIIKATAPVVAQHSETITRTFYRTMFKNDPAVLHFFNPAHQAGEEPTQPRALANAVVAYAVNIEHLERLGGAVELMAQKHCALMITADQYSIVGKNLMLAIHEVLGAAVTQQVHDAWVAAYTQLAEILIGREKAIYAEQLATPGGWNGYRDFTVKAATKDGEALVLSLTPKDGKAIMKPKPGQYLTLKFEAATGVAAGSPIAPRNYSLISSAEEAGAGVYRIAVKHVPKGVISSHIHATVVEGATLKVGPPVGEFVYAAGAKKPAVFVAGGIGVTPLVAMVRAAAKEGRPVRWVEASRGAQPAFVRAALAEVPTLQLLHVANTAAHAPRVTACALLAMMPDLKECEVYACGPRQMVVDVLGGLEGAGVPAGQLHYEFFGPKAPITPVPADKLEAMCPFAAAHRQHGHEHAHGKPAHA